MNRRIVVGLFINKDLEDRLRLGKFRALHQIFANAFQLAFKSTLWMKLFLDSFPIDMAKEGKKQQTPKKPSVPNRDGFSRASFLYQAAHVTKNPEVSRMYIRLMDLVTKRTVLKVSPHVKRSVCKTCNRLQQPGKTSMMTLEGEGKKSETLQIECVCGTTKRFPVGKNKDYIPFVDRKS